MKRFFENTAIALLLAAVWAGELLQGATLGQRPVDRTAYRTEWRYDAQGQHKSVVRIRCDLDKGAAYGSGVVIRWGTYPRPIAVTASHVVQGARSITVQLADGRTLPARLVPGDSVDTLWDLALIEFEPVEGLFCSAVETATVPKRGEELALAGYGSDGRLAVADAIVQRFAKPSGSNATTTDWLRMESHCRFGDSGGPIFNAAGHVAGIVWGKEDPGDVVYGTQNGRITVVLNRCCGGGRSTAAPRPPARSAPPQRRLTLVEFYADWCGACPRMVPVLDALRARGYAVRRVNVDRDRAMAERYHVTLLPTTVILDGDRDVDRVTGVTTAADLEARIRRAQRTVDRTGFNMGINGICPWNRQQGRDSVPAPTPVPAPNPAPPATPPLPPPPVVAPPPCCPIPPPAAENPEPTAPDPGLPGWAIASLIIGAMLLGAVVYYGPMKG